MVGLRFSWDPRKARENERKHRIGFAEAATAFGDPISITIPDLSHSSAERRFVLIGQSDTQRLLVVIHAEQRESEIRLISARLATRHERRAYEEED